MHRLFHLLLTLLQVLLQQGQQLTLVMCHETLLSQLFPDLLE